MIKREVRWSWRDEIDVALVVEIVVERNVSCGVSIDLDFLLDVDAVAGAERGGDCMWRREGAGKGELEGRGWGDVVD